jgi:hypothetical protein
VPYPVPLFQPPGKQSGGAVPSEPSAGGEDGAAALTYPSWAYPRNYIAPSRNRQVGIPLQIWLHLHPYFRRGLGQVDAASQHHPPLACRQQLVPLSERK